ncbi:MAG: DUF5996 family protein [Bacteroidota bacterium]
MGNYQYPFFPLKEWEPTKETLHRYIQIVGKIRLANMPRKNHWWFITLYVNSRGLYTDSISYNDFTFDIQFDFVDHQLRIHTSKGESGFFELKNGLSVADFYARIIQELGALGIETKIVAKPYDLSDEVPFDKCTMHNSYDNKKVNQAWQLLVGIDQIFKEFSGRSYSKTCPVHLYWHHMDLAVTRFSGKKGPPMPDAGPADRDAYSHEVISFGFWFGDKDVPNPAFYSYTYPSPEGIDKEEIAPSSAHWIDANGSPMAFLDYEEWRKLENPKKALLDFLESTYQAGAKLAEWDIGNLRVDEI